MKRRVAQSHSHTTSRQTLLAVACSAVSIAALWTSDASADRKIFAHTYPYGTLPQGGLELEHYLDANFDETDDPDTEEVAERAFRPTWTHQIEVEAGLTDHVDLGVYNVLEQKPHDSLHYRGLKVRSRVRFGEEGELLVDPALYLEVAYLGDEVEIEQRLILAKRFGGLETSLNLKLEQEFEFEHGETEFAQLFVPSFGIGYHFTESISLAAEYLGRLKVEHGEIEYFANYLGPVVSAASGRFWWTLGVLPELNAVDERPDLLARSVLAVVL